MSHKCLFRLLVKMIELCIISLMFFSIICLLKASVKRGRGPHPSKCFIISGNSLLANGMSQVICIFNWKRVYTLLFGYIPIEPENNEAKEMSHILWNKKKSINFIVHVPITFLFPVTQILVYSINTFQINYLKVHLVIFKIEIWK